MDRREFIVKGGTMLTMASFFSSSMITMAANNTMKTASSSHVKRPNPDDYQQPIMKAIALGINAPSPHNTQSWKFEILDDYTMNLYVDENQLLPATDPPSRQIHMGAGCFIETMVLGANRLNYESEVNYFPQAYSDADFGKKPVASIHMTEGAKTKDNLAAYIETRQSNRKPYKGAYIQQSEFEQLVDLSGESYSKLLFINENMEPYFNLFSKAFEIESKTYKTNEETRKLFRFSEEERAAKGDGVSIPQMGMSGLIQKVAESSLKEGDHDTWHSEKSIKLSMKGINKGIWSSKGIVIWYTEQNEFIDWVKAGRDYVRFSLAMTQKGLYSHPYNQVIQEYDEMSELRDEFNKMLDISAPQKIQMVIRIGRSTEPYLSYRRNFDKFLYTR